MGQRHAVIPERSLPQHASELDADLHQDLGDIAGLFRQGGGTVLLPLHGLIAPLRHAQDVVAVQQKILVAAPFLEAAFLRQELDVILGDLQLSLFDEFSVAGELRADKPARQRQNAEIVPV